MKTGISHPNHVKDSFTVLTIIFLMWGFITVANGILVQQLEGAIEMSENQKRFLGYVFFLVYFIAAYPAALIVERVGFKKAVIIGLITSAACSVFMIPAARELSYWLVLCGIVVLAAGVTILQVAANPYAMLIGQQGLESSSLVKNQAFNSIGTWLAPLIAVMVTNSGMSDGLEGMALLKAQTEIVVLPYVLFSVILAGLTIRLNFSTLPDMKDLSQIIFYPAEDKGSAFAYRHVLFGALAIFCYVAAEVVIGSNLAEYLESTPGLEDFKGSEVYLVGYYWGSAMVGRFIGAQLLETIKTHKLIVFSAVGSLFLLSLSLANHGVLAMVTIIFIGLFNSVLFPAIFALTAKGMGKYTAQVSALLNMAIIGGAMSTLAYNELKDVLGEELVFNFPAVRLGMFMAIPMYVYLIFFGASGYQCKLKK